MTLNNDPIHTDRVLVESQHAVFGYGRRRVVDAGNLLIASGSILGIFGPNGAGKTTLVRGLLQLAKPQSGTLNALPQLRRGYVSQRRSLELHWPMSGLDVAMMPMSAHTPWYRRPPRQPVMAWIERLQIDREIYHPFAELSGGQQQRIILAGVLATDPQLLILDEPTDGLDLRSRRIVLDMLRRCAAGGMGIVIVSHDVQDIVEVCDTVVQLHVAEEPDSPSSIESMTPARFADRIAHLRQQVAS